MYRNNDIDYLKFLRGKKIIIFGAGKSGKSVFKKLSKCVGNIEIIAFCDNDEKKQDTLVMDIQVISFEKLCKMNAQDFLIVIGSNYEREIKEQLLSQGIYNFISSSQIDFGGGEDYYDEDYFAWQQSMGEFGGELVRVCFSHI